jgi:hypothetical protein
MATKDKADYARQIAEARVIARGIFDKRERRKLLKLISDYNKLLPKRPAI